jgi:histidyl-tRNA synthetase
MSAKPNAMTSVKGMNDILPADSKAWEWLEQHLRDAFAAAGFKNIRTPIVEYTPVFVKGTGETTDIVEKEMYSFQDRLNGEHLTLRPENTPGVMRAAIEHNLTYEGGQRLYYIGPMFRHERPQRGRYRQFHQVGAETLGFAGPQADAEAMLLVWDIFRRIGLNDVRLEINSLGVLEERKAHREALIAHFEAHADVLDDDARRRLHTNPLRILDTKNPAMRALVEAAPQLVSYLGEPSLKRLQTVQTLLSACGVPWTLSPRLVRGLDYYSHTVFEFITEQLGAQGAVAGGGRYDGLAEMLGGKPTPGVGWAMGMERVLDLLQTQGVTTPAATLHAYAVVPDLAAMPQAFACVQALRNTGLNVQMHASPDGAAAGMKNQFKKADASGAQFALIFGADELAQGSVAVKSLRQRDAVQTLQPLANVTAWAFTLR